MHNFTDLVDGCIQFTLESLNGANTITIRSLEKNSATSLVKTLQMIQLQKAILAVGIFSIFEANLQENLCCSHGFEEVKKILENEGELSIKDRFEDFILAINVLKHGRGRSYDTLVAKAESLSFKVKLPNEPFFDEGDISEVSTLIEVNDAFVQSCSNLIDDVSRIIHRVNNDSPK